MKKIPLPIRLFSVLLGLVLPAFFAVAAFANNAVVIDGVAFSVTKVTYGQWTKPQPASSERLADSAGKEFPAIPYVAISFAMDNKNTTKKIDLGWKIECKLFDEFGNRYRAMKRPDDYQASLLSISKNFPSLYPGEQYKETVFFEAPIKDARTMKLVVASADLKLSRPVELVFATDTIQPMPVELLAVKKEVVSDVKPAGAITVPPAAESAEIMITSPEQGVVWDQGQSARVQIELPSGPMPRNIIVIGFDNTFNDVSPARNNVYDINVPADQPPGEYLVNIIAHWPDERISSATLRLFVKDATPLGVI
ncbi:MAG: hypothetical protein HQL20_05575 [Candidatus Omnitrophica bacterium]|nr:hypothetical protein [Candidatus Omnitrophota bacterium]